MGALAGPVVVVGVVLVVVVLAVLVEPQVVPVLVVLLPMVMATASLAVALPVRATLPNEKIFMLAALRTPEDGMLLGPTEYTVTRRLKAAATKRFVPSQASDIGVRSESAASEAWLISPPSCPMMTSAEAPF